MSIAPEMPAGGVGLHPRGMFGTDGAVQGLGTITFPPGVRERRFTISALKGAGTQKTLVIGLTNPTGPTPVASGDNAVAKITINARAR